MSLRRKGGQRSVWSLSAQSAALTMGLPGPMLGKMAPVHAGGHCGGFVWSLLQVGHWRPRAGPRSHCEVG